MFKLIKEAELKFPEKPAVSAEAKDFISKVIIIIYFDSIKLAIISKSENIP